MTTYIFIALIVFLSGLIQGLTGFGAALISIPLLTIVLNIKTVVPLVALNGIVLLTIMFVKLKQHVDFRLTAPLIIGSLPGLPVGIYILKFHDESLIKIILAVVLISYSLYSLFIKDIRLNLGARAGWLFGFGAGILGGAIAANGPAVVIYASLKGWAGDKFKAALTGFFIVNATLVVTAHAASGVTTMEALQYFVTCAPFMAMGTVSGMRLSRTIDPFAFRKIVYALVLVMGLMMIPV